MVTQTRKPVSSGLDWTPPEHSIVRLYFKGTRESIDFITQVIQDRFGIYRSYDAVRHQAKLMGLTKCKGLRWGKKDAELITELAGKYTAKQIARKLNRSLHAIHSKARKLGVVLDSCSRNDWYTLCDLMEIFGVADSTINNWVSQKLLKCTKYDEGTYKFQSKDVKSFICKYPMELTGRNVDLLQIVGILCPYISIENKR